MEVLQLLVVCLKLVTLVLIFPLCGESHVLEDVIYVDCINGTLDTRCWNGGADMPCASLEMALQGAELLNASVLLTHPGQCAMNGGDKSFSAQQAEQNEIESADLVLDVPESEMVACPLWFIQTERNGTTVCECGDEWGGIIKCEERSQQVFLLSCYCVTHSEDKNNTAVLGACFYNCFHGEIGSHQILPSNLSELDDSVCKKYNRKGQLCGECEDGLSPPVYSFDLACVQCPHSNWAKYLAVAFLPLTAFFVAIVVFRVSIASAPLKLYVLVCQILTMGANMHIILTALRNSEYTTSQFPMVLTQILATVYGIWNLDFFRTLYPPFCLAPGMNTLDVIATDYAIALYPLLLIVITYACIELHAHNCRPIVVLWKPFHKCFARLRRSCDAKTSIIDAFASFILMSYVKFAELSFDLVLATRLRSPEGNASERVVYYQGTIEFLGTGHLPFFLVAFMTLIMFVLLPPLILILHPLKCCQRCMGSYHRRFRALHIFVESFQGCFKDGTNGTRDCRYFSVVYMFVRVAILFVLVLTVSSYYFAMGSMLFILTAIAVFVIRPYKKDIYNVADTVLLLTLAMWYLTILSYTAQEFRYFVVSVVLSFLLAIVPLVYITIVLIHWIYLNKVAQKIWQMVRSATCHRELQTDLDVTTSILPDRVLNPHNYESSVNTLLSEVDELS